MTDETLIWTASIIFSILWALLLFTIGQSKKNLTALFYFLAFLPLLFTLIPALYLTGLLSMTLRTVILGLFIVERIVWAYTLKITSGEDKLSWFFIIYYFPVFGWLFYWATRWR